MVTVVAEATVTRKWTIDFGATVTLAVEPAMFLSVTPEPDENVQTWATLLM